MDGDTFDWNPTKDEVHSIVIRDQPAIAVYINPHDEIVVRQRDHYGYDDQFVYITKENVPQVAERMLALAGYPTCEILSPEPKDKTAAARQKRYKDRHARNVTTDRDAAPLLITAAE